MFEEAALRHAGSPAAVEGERLVTWAEVAERVRGRAGILARAGVRAGDRVALLEHNTLAFLELTFAAAHLGAVLVPLNTRLAVPELAACLRDAEPRVLVHGAGLAEPARAAAAMGGPSARAEPAAVLGTEEGDASDAPEPAAVEPEDLAFLYYTSGTTGVAKGVMLTHGNVCAHARMAIAELGLTSADRWGHVAPMFHLADAWATLAITAVGGVHVLCPRFEPAAVPAAIERHGITITNLVPTMLNLIAAEAATARCDLSSMRTVLSGGAPISPTLVRRVMELFACEYVQTYGLTETSPFLTVSLLRDSLRALPAEEAFRLRARTGRPFGDVQVEVVDEHGRRVPPDDTTVGEVRARGATVTPGYWRRPDATAEAIRDGWLYTGDLAVVDAQGYLQIVDRKKDMILTGGENVYSTEVENVLAAHPAVLEVAVYGRPDELWGEVVCAAVALREGATADAEALIAFCRERLAGYKTPRAVRFLDALPKTGSGKIQKRALREADA